MLLRRFDLRALLAAACAGTALRWWLVSRADGAAALVLLQLFHALTFGLWWACAVEAMGRLVPVSLRATGQALFSALVELCALPLCAVAGRRLAQGGAPRRSA